MTIKREEKALREFKLIVKNLVNLLRQATGAHTTYLYWVNRARKQFVMEANSTSLTNVMFIDRVAFEEHYLNPYRNISKQMQIPVGERIQRAALEHHSDDTPVKQVSLIPFINNNETVAISVIETEDSLNIEKYEESIQSYIVSLKNVLNTYLELTALYEDQQEWVEYEEKLEHIHSRLHKTEIFSRMLNEMQNFLPDGGVSLIARGMDGWVNVLNSSGNKRPLMLGLMVDEKSLVYECLKSGKPEFSIHFNQNPKRLSSDETATVGATIAIPLIIDDRRYAAIVVYDNNPLVFKESVKHKLQNLVRVAGLSVRANLGKISVEDDLLTSEYGSFIPDLWEKTIENSIVNKQEDVYTWFGFITIENLQTLRSKYRLEELQRMQRTLVKALNPSRFKTNGYIGFNSDYVFAYIIQDRSEDAADRWISGVDEMLEKPVLLSDGQEMKVEMTAAYSLIKGNETDYHPVVQNAKSALSDAVKVESNRKGFFSFG